MRQLWRCIFCWLTAFGYSNNQREATLLCEVGKAKFWESLIYMFLQQFWYLTLKGEPLPKFFCRRGLQWQRLHLLIYFTEVIKFCWLMLLLYPGELYRLLGASIGTCRVNLVTNLVINHDWVNEERTVKCSCSNS